MKMKQIKESIEKCNTIIDNSRMEPVNKKYTENYQQGLLEILKQTCLEYVKVIDHYCISVAGRCTPIVAFTKLKGDLCRYVAQNDNPIKSVDTDCNDEQPQNHLQNINFKTLTLAHYRFAEHLQKRIISIQLNLNQDVVMTAIRLSLSINYSLFLYEIYGEKKRGLRKLNDIVTAALDDFDKWDQREGQVEKINKCLDVMKENQNKWREETEVDSEEDN